MVRTGLSKKKRSKKEQTEQKKKESEQIFHSDSNSEKSETSKEEVQENNDDENSEKNLKQDQNQDYNQLIQDQDDDLEISQSNKEEIQKKKDGNEQKNEQQQENIQLSQVDQEKNQKCQNQQEDMQPCFTEKMGVEEFNNIQAQTDQLIKTEFSAIGKYILKFGAGKTSKIWLWVFLTGCDQGYVIDNLEKIRTENDGLKSIKQVCKLGEHILLISFKDPVSYAPRMKFLQEFGIATAYQVRDKNFKDTRTLYQNQQPEQQKPEQEQQQQQQQSAENNKRVQSRESSQEQTLSKKHKFDNNWTEELYNLEKDRIQLQQQQATTLFEQQQEINKRILEKEELQVQILKQQLKEQSKGGEVAAESAQPTFIQTGSQSKEKTSNKKNEKVMVQQTIEHMNYFKDNKSKKKDELIQNLKEVDVSLNDGSLPDWLFKFQVAIKKYNEEHKPVTSNHNGKVDLYKQIASYFSMLHMTEKQRNISFPKQLSILAPRLFKKQQESVLCDTEDQFLEGIRELVKIYPGQMAINKNNLLGECLQIKVGFSLNEVIEILDAIE